jgi:hypothetical protein
MPATTQSPVNLRMRFTNPEFAHWFNLGLIWYRAGEMEGELTDEYFIDNVCRIVKKRTPSEDIPSHVGFYLGMFAGKLEENK